MKKYFLVARDKDTNEFSIIKLKDKWYDASGKGEFYRANDLAAIDVVTTKFSSADEMIDKMYQNGYIDSSNVDLFIATGVKRNGKFYVKYHEVIYDNSDVERIDNFKKVSRGFLNGTENEQEINLVFYKLCTKYFFDKEFASYINSGFTSIPKGVVEYLRSAQSDKPAYSLRYDAAWIMKSYPFIRSIVETFNRYDLFVDKKNKIDANVEYINTTAVNRKKIEKSLMKQMDPNFLEGQLTLFEESNQDEDKKNTSIVSLEEKKLRVRRNENFVSTNTKRSYVMNTFYELSLDIFKFNGADVKINGEMFGEYSTGDDIIKLESLLTGNLLKQMYRYVLHNTKYKHAYKNNLDTLELEREIRSDTKALRKSFENETKLDKAYNWCVTFNECMSYSEEEKVKLFEKRNGEIS